MLRWRGQEREVAGGEPDSFAPSEFDDSIDTLGGLPTQDLYRRLDGPILVMLGALIPVSDTLRNLSTATTALAKQDAAIQSTLAELPGAITEFRHTFNTLNGLAESLNLVAIELGPQDAASRKALAGKDPGELRKVLAEARAALANIDATAGSLNRLVADNKGPIRSFTETGLNEFSLALRELRQLTANLNVIATKLERDPASPASRHGSDHEVPEPVTLLSGSDSALVDPAATLGTQGALVLGQSQEGCYDPAAPRALAARGAELGSPAQLAQRLTDRWF